MNDPKNFDPAGLGKIPLKRTQCLLCGVMIYSDTDHKSGCRHHPDSPKGVTFPHSIGEQPEDREFVEMMWKNQLLTE